MADAARGTADVLLDEYVAIHGVPDDVGPVLRALHEAKHDPNRDPWPGVRTAEEEYAAGNPTRPWAQLDAAEQGREREAHLRRHLKGQEREGHAALVHALGGARYPAGQTALCLSGGGIRSAAFALGVLQGMARHGLLKQFHYLSTVSGGGYIGGWLTAWASRAAKARTPGKRQDFAGVEASLAARVAPMPVRDLRQRQAFLTPKTGLGSADTWAAVAHVVRNLLLNWLVFLPLLAALLLLPRVVEAVLLHVTHSAPDQPSSSLEQLLYLATGSGAPVFPPGSHFWLDTAAFVLVLLGLVFSMVNRATAGKDAIGDQGFARYVLAPVVLGAFLLLLATCSWMSTEQGWVVAPVMFWLWTVLCAIAFPLIRVVALGWMLLRRRGQADSEQGQPWRFPLELVAQAVAGALVGLVAWAGLKLRETVGGAGMLDLRDVAVFGLPWFLMAFLAGQILLSGLTSHLFPASGDRNREWLARASGWYGAVAVGWIAFFGVVLYGWTAFQWAWGTLLALTLGSGAATLLGGASPLSKAVAATGLGERLRFTTIVSALSVVFVLCLSAWIAHGTALLLEAAAGAWHGAGRPLLALEAPLLETAWTSDVPLVGADARAVAWDRLTWTSGAGAALFALALFASAFVNVNYFSLNALYRNRLVRAFLGASNVETVTGTPLARNPFDGFAEKDTPDNPPMADTWAPGRGQPFPVVNMALNLTATENTAWQERKAAAFTVSPLHAGGELVRYRPVDRYAGGVTLGTAMSISGAAVSPNWGYHSSPLTSFLLAIFNLRLGCWIGNPGRARWTSDGPLLGLQLLWQEAMGRTSDRHSYVYLSDGGHFENLGLYEMVRRRCRTIVVSDAGADPGCALADLGNALRKIAIDLDVRIEFDRIDMGRRGPDPANPGVYCATGRITYPEPGAPEGVIVYIKPGLYGALPADVRAYAAANAKFPHDTTLNQWFTESQFESYRALGSHAIDIITRPGAEEAADAAKKGRPVRTPDLGWFVASANNYLELDASKTPKPTRVRLVS